MPDKAPPLLQLLNKLRCVFVTLSISIDFPILFVCFSNFRNFPVASSESRIYEVACLVKSSIHRLHVFQVHVNASKVHEKFVVHMKISKVQQFEEKREKKYIFFNYMWNSCIKSLNVSMEYVKLTHTQTQKYQMKENFSVMYSLIVLEKVSKRNLLFL